MTTIRELYRAITGKGQDDEDVVTRLIRLADAAPEDEDAQVVGAYKAWVHGDDATAHRLALRAVKTDDDTAFPVLLVMLALSSKGTDDERTYKYAKLLLASTRPDRKANRVARIFAGTGLTGPGSRAEQLTHLRSTEKNHDSWVAWAKGFALAYEAREGDA